VLFYVVGKLTSGSEMSWAMMNVAEFERILWRFFREGVSVQAPAL